MCCKINQRGFTLKTYYHRLVQKQVFVADRGNVFDIWNSFVILLIFSVINHCVVNLFDRLVKCRIKFLLYLQKEISEVIIMWR